MNQEERRLQRLNYILDLVAENPLITRDEVDAELEIEDYVHDSERGFDSEENVKKVLEGFPFVVDVRYTEPFGEEDMGWKDLVVALDDGQLVFVQVKSSVGAVGEFINKHEEFDILYGKFVVLNGQNTHEMIEKDFLRQVAVIDDFQRKYGLTPILADVVREFIRKRLVRES